MDLSGEKSSRDAEHSASLELAGEHLAADAAIAALGAMDADRVRRVLERLLERACEQLGAQRGVLFQCGPAQNYADAVHEWHAEGVYPVKGGRYRESEAPDCFRYLRAGRPVVFLEHESEPLCRLLHKVLLEQGSRGAVLTPLHHETALEWIAVFEWRHEVPVLDDAVVAFCRRVGEAAHAALRRGESLRVEGQAQQKLADRQKLESLGVMAGGIAHDFNNVLQSVLSASEILVQEVPSGIALEMVENIQRVATRAAGLTSKLLVFSRQDARDFQLVDVASVVKEAVSLLRHSIPEDRRIEVDLAPDAGLVGISPLDFEQVIINLCNNAAAAMPEGGVIRIAAHRQEGEPPAVELSVRDTGTGMSEETLGHACEPFFTTKPPGEGTGLGLAIVKRVVAAAAGKLRITSEPGRGTCVTLSLPLTQGTLSSLGPQTPVVVKGDETILLVEDDPMVRRVAATHLERAGFEVLPAADGEEALALYRSRGSDIALVFTDAIMPKMGGAALYDAIAAEGRPPPFLFGSGYDAGSLSPRFLSLPERAFLQKPYQAAHLLRAVRRLIDEGKARRSSDPPYVPPPR